MKLKAQTTFLIASLVVVLGVAATMVTGLWETSSDRIPQKLETVSVTSPVGEAATVYDPADIRGSYTFGDITKYFAIPLADLAEAFQLAEGEADAFQVKALEKVFDSDGLEIGTASVRMFTACYLGLPYEPTEETWLPASAAQVLAVRGHMTETQAAYVAVHTYP